jgi:endonuclease III
MVRRQPSERKRMKLAYEDLQEVEDLQDKQQQREVEEKSINELVSAESAVLMKGPKNWEIVYDLLRSYRATHEAPVDILGCTKLSHADSPPSAKRFHCLCGLLLSSQTKDCHTHAAMTKLHHFVASTTYLSPQSMRAIPLDTLERLIYPVGFYRKKAANLHRLCDILMERYHSDIPKTLHELLALPGIGPKMVYL